jgi:hypothetical protein
MPRRGERLTDEEFECWWDETGERELRELLYRAWDPIGVSGSFPFAVDEYDGYARRIVRLLRAGRTDTEIAAMLEAVERDQMGLGHADRDQVSDRANSSLVRAVPAALDRVWAAPALTARCRFDRKRGLGQPGPR